MNHNSENDYKIEKYEGKFGQFAKKREIAMTLVPREAAILVLLEIQPELNPSNPCQLHPTTSKRDMKHYL